MINQNQLSLAKDFKKNFPSRISIKEAWLGEKNYPEWVYYSLAGEFSKRLLQAEGREKLALASNNSFEYAQHIYGDTLFKVINELEQELN